MQKCFDTQKESLETQNRAELSTSKIFLAIITTYNGQSRAVELKTCRNLFDTEKERLEIQSTAKLRPSKIFLAIITTYNCQSRSVEFKTRRNVLTPRRKA